MSEIKIRDLYTGKPDAKDEIEQISLIISLLMNWKHITAIDRFLRET